MSEVLINGRRYYSADHVLNAQTEAHKLRKENDELRALIKEIAYFGEALITREYEPGSQTIVELVERARSLTGT